MNRISFRSGMPIITNIITNRLYSLTPFWMSLAFAQDGRGMRSQTVAIAYHVNMLVKVDKWMVAWTGPCVHLWGLSLCICSSWRKSIYLTFIFMYLYLCHGLNTSHEQPSCAGHGESQDTDLGDLSTEDFMLALVDKLGTKPVIVAPSMAGSFALPYLFGDPQASTKRAAGFVPVSPVGSDWFTEAYPNSQVSLLLSCAFWIWVSYFFFFLLLWCKGTVQLTILKRVKITILFLLCVDWNH